MNHLLDEFVEKLIRAIPMQARSIDAALRELTPDELSGLQAYVLFCTSEGVSVDDLVTAYQTITQDTLTEQIHFKRAGHYRHSTFAEVAETVYFNPAYMSRYMYGLALTLYLWPNHRQMARFFERSIQHRKGDRYLEIGPGHGVFFRTAIRKSSYRHYLGVDISPTSLELTRRLVAAETDLTGLWDLQLADFLEQDDLQPGFDAVVMGEVLEHVETPLAFLTRIRELAKPGAFIFVTTAVNAPAVDHIFLFSSVDDVVALCRAASLEVVEIEAPPYMGCTMEETVRLRLPINVALVLAA